MSFEERSVGKDQEYQAGIEIDGIFYTNLQLIKAIVKALIKKGVITKQEILAEL